MTVMVYQLDSFTRTRFAGNPAGVVTGGEQLTSSEMQAIARELNNSETAFLLPALDTDHDVFIRYFTPTTEVPTCGHATLAALTVEALSAGENLGRRIIRNGAGLSAGRADVDGGNYLAWMEQGLYAAEPVLDEPTQIAVLGALGLTVSHANPETPMRVGSTGHSKVLVGLHSRVALNTIVPDDAMLSALSRQIGSNGFFVFALTPDDVDIAAEARMFAPAIGIREDPVTGNGNGPLGGYLVSQGLVNIEGGRAELRTLQGQQMGRPGHCQVRVTQTADGLQITIGGYVTPVFSALL